MPTYSKSLVIFTLFTVLWLENKAHRCSFPHEKTQKKFGKEKTSSKKSTAALKSTPAKGIKVNSKCNTGTVPSCKCGISTAFDGTYYYPVPKSGNCNDVFKRLSTTKHLSDYHFREEKCHKVQRAVCRIDATCEDENFIPDNHIASYPTPDEFVLGQNVSKPFCKCGDDGGHYPMPKSGNCTDLETKTTTGASDNWRYDFGCYKAQTLCWDTCYCNEFIGSAGQARDLSGD